MMSEIKNIDIKKPFNPAESLCKSIYFDRYKKMFFQKHKCPDYIKPYNRS